MKNLLLLGLLAGLIGLTACGKRDKDGDDKENEEVAIPVEMGEVTRATVFAAYSGTATLEAEAEADIVAKTAGVILDILVEEGDLVEKNQVVARLDGDRLRLEVERAKANLEKLERDFSRSEGLYEKRLISHDQFEKLRFDVESQRATYNLARLELSYTEVRSPIGGVVSERLVKAGRLVSQYEALFRVDDFDPLEAVLHVPERELRTLRPGLRADIEVDAVPSQVFAGKVARISPIVDSRTGTFKVTVELPKPDPRLKPGMFGRINIVHDVREQVVTIPRDALVIEDRGAFVYVLDWQEPKLIDQGDESESSDKGRGEAEEPKMTSAGYRAIRKNIQTGYSTDGRVEVLAGLDADSNLDVGLRVVTNGKGSLNDDVLLKVINLPTDDPHAPENIPQLAEPGESEDATNEDVAAADPS